MINFLIFHEHIDVMKKKNEKMRRETILSITLTYIQYIFCRGMPHYIKSTSSCMH